MSEVKHTTSGSRPAETAQPKPHGTGKDEKSPTSPPAHRESTEKGK